MRRPIKKWFPQIFRLFILLLLILAMPTMASAYNYTDDLGRTVSLPNTINKFAPSGAMAEIVLYSVNPAKLAGWANAPTPAQQQYINYTAYPNLANLPVFGQIYGGSGIYNVDAVKASGAQVIVDVGQIKGSVAEMANAFDELQAEAGIPVVFIRADDLGAPVHDYDRVYERLSIFLLNDSAQIYALQGYCFDTKEYIETQREAIPQNVAETRTIYYGEGPDGLLTNGTWGPGAIHQDIMRFIGGINVADIESASGQGLTPVTIGQVQGWDPDAIIFGPGSYYDYVADDPDWEEISAVRNGKYVQVPDARYNWIGRPPSVNRMLGAQWLAHIMFPEYYPAYSSDALPTIVDDFYNLFYHYDLSPAQINAILSAAEFVVPNWNNVGGGGTQDVQNYYQKCDPAQRDESLIGDPIDTATGAHIVQEELIKINGAISFTFDLSYNSMMLEEGPLGKGWSHNYEARLEPQPAGSVKLRWTANRSNTFSPVGGNQYISLDQSCRADLLVQNSDGSYDLTRKDQSVYKFNPAGQLTQILNGHGQLINLAYDGSGRLQTVGEPLSGKGLTLAYTGSLLTGLTDSLNRQITLTYNTGRNLTGITYPGNKTTSFTYDAFDQI